MTNLPEVFQYAWKEREGFAVFSTADSEQTPNAIYVAYVEPFDKEHFVIGDVFLNKTKENVKSGSKGSLLFLSQDYQSFQIKGNLEYFTSGKYFDFLLDNLGKDIELEGVIVLEIESFYCDGENF